MSAPQVAGSAFLPYWEGLERSEIRLPRCAACGRYHWYPEPRCPHCAAPELTWKSVSPEGTVFTLTTVRRVLVPAPGLVAPYGVALVDLAEAVGCRLLVNFDPGSHPAIDAAVRIGFNRRSAGPPMPWIGSGADSRSRKGLSK